MGRSVLILWSTHIGHCDYFFKVLLHEKQQISRFICDQSCHALKADNINQDLCQHLELWKFEVFVLFQVSLCFQNMKLLQPDSDNKYQFQSFSRHDDKIAWAWLI